MAQPVDEKQLEAEQSEQAALLREKTKEYQKKGKVFEATGVGVMPDEEWQRRKGIPADQIPEVQND